MGPRGEGCQNPTTIAGRCGDGAVGIRDGAGTYRETPFDEPARGREAIAGYWASFTAGQEGRFGHEVSMVANDIGIARWWASFLRIRSDTPVELDGMFVIRMDRCEELREWCHSREHDPERD